MPKYLKFTAIGIILALIVLYIYAFATHKISLFSESFITARLKEISKIKTDLLEERISILNLVALDSNSNNFQQEKNGYLLQISEANKDLQSAIADYESGRNNKGKFVLMIFDKSQATRIDITEIKKVSSEIDTMLSSFEKIGAVTEKIYSIYLLSDYIRLGLNTEDLNTAKIENIGFFADIKNVMQQLNWGNFDITKLLISLDSTQLAFENCLNQAEKENVTYADLENCEDSLQIKELKVEAYHAELTYLTSDDFVNTLTSLTNEAYLLEAAVNSIVEKYNKILE